MSYSRDTLAAFSDALGALYAAETPEAALQAALPKLGALFHSRHAVVDELPTDGRPPIFHGSLNLTDWGDVPHFYGEFIHEHPGTPIVRAGGLLPVQRITEFLTERQFAQTGLYQECFRVVGARDQICFGFRRPNSALAITLHRETAFSDDEAYLGLRLHEHIAHVLQTGRPKGLDVAGENAWELPVTRDGRVEGIGPLPAELLARYFPGQAKGGGVPQPVRDWLERQLETLANLGPGAKCVRVFSVQAPCGRLNLQVRAATSGREHGLLRIVEERGPADFFRLRAHGLTSRECEVVFWIAQGKRDAEIATILGCATKTASKHVENVLAKLSAETRLGAAHTAQEWLRRHG